MRLVIGNESIEDGLGVFLVQEGNGAVSMKVKEPNGETWYVFRINTDGTGTLWRFLRSTILKVSRSTQIKLRSME